MSQIYGVPMPVDVHLTASQDGDVLTVPLGAEHIREVENEAAFQPDFFISFAQNGPFADKAVIETLRNRHREVGLVTDRMAEAYLSPENVFPPA
jgi:hypothetical protein